MNYLSIIVPPIVGSIIGYSTNWLAVKMLFRPLKPVKIGKFTIPFTPGLIPKSKPRLAKALGEAVSTNLLSTEDFAKSMLSENAINSLKSSIENFIADENNCAKNNILSYFSENDYNKLVSFSSDKLSDIILEKLKEKNIGNIISLQIQNVASEKMKGSLIGFFGGNSIISSLGEPIESAINNYIDENGKDILFSMCKDELCSLLETNYSKLISSTGFDKEKVSEIITDIYMNFITNKLSFLIESINIAGIIENKILEMDLLDLEKLILSVMKNELKALVNLGALIGFILGIINIWF